MVGIVFGSHVGFVCFLSNPWHLYPVSLLLPGSRWGVEGEQISITRSGSWESIALFGVGALENPGCCFGF